MMRYAQIDSSGMCVAVSDLSGEVDSPNMIIIGDEEDPIGMRWENGYWVQGPDEPEAISPLGLVTIASADLSVEGGDVGGVGRAMGLEMAFMIDEDTAWLFFSSPQPDTDYIVTPYEGVTKYEDYIEVVKPNASRIQVLVQRLQ